MLLWRPSRPKTRTTWSPSWEPKRRNFKRPWMKQSSQRKPPRRTYNEFKDKWSKSPPLQRKRRPSKIRKSRISKLKKSSWKAEKVNWSTKSNLLDDPKQGRSRAVRPKFNCYSTKLSKKSKKLMRGRKIWRSSLKPRNRKCNPCKRLSMNSRSSWSRNSTQRSNRSQPWLGPTRKISLNSYWTNRIHLLQTCKKLYKTRRIHIKQISRILLQTKTAF